MLNIFNYMNYREYLTEWFSEKKKTNKAFSYASFADKAGFKDRGFLHNVIHGKRDLTKGSLVKVSRAIGHSQAEAEYFENLVYFNKAQDFKDRNYFFEKLNTVKHVGKTAAQALRTRTDQHEFYSEWYHAAVRSVIDMYPFRDDFKWLARTIHPPISVRQAKKSVELLERLGFIERRADGVFKLADKSITTGDEIISLAVQNFHKETTSLARYAIESLPLKKRNITGLTLGISETTYRTICEEIRIFRAKIAALAECDESADRTYQLNFHLFPITRTDIRSKEGA